MASYAQIANDLAAWRLKLVGTGNDKLCSSLRRAETTIREMEAKLDRCEKSVFDLQERDRKIAELEAKCADLERAAEDEALRFERYRNGDDL